MAPPVVYPVAQAVHLAAVLTLALHLAEYVLTAQAVQVVPSPQYPLLQDPAATMRRKCHSILSLNNLLPIKG